MTVGTEKKRQIAQRDLRIAEMYSVGLTQAQIAAAERISPALVSLTLSRVGARIPKEEAMQKFIKAGARQDVRKKVGLANRRPIADRFFSKVTLGLTPNCCWGWLGAFDGAGYPQITYDGRRAKASHVSLMIDGRPRTGNLCALHTCDNPECTNPRHLWWGTQAENIRDAKEKGRLNLDGLALGLPARLAKAAA